VHFVLLNQTFYPDVMATGQHLSELAVELVSRGHQVTVITGRRAYDEPTVTFSKREYWRGINIIRVASTRFGKNSKLARACDFASFLICCCLQLMFLPSADVILALTSPPLISVLAAVFAKIRRARFVYWVMDLNPDEAIAAGWLIPNSFPARMLERLSVFSLRRANKIVVLDRYMRQRVFSKGVGSDKIMVLPPWSHDNVVRFDAVGREAFRKKHGLEGKFVVMYSGNHSPCHPLDTLLEAARQMQGDRELIFCFIGGGSEFRRIQRSLAEGRDSAPVNIVCIPYQPLEALSASLSAADLHVVVMGEPFVGLVHPCKVYNILNVGTPFLYIGPARSHVTDIYSAGANGICLRATHGEVKRVIEHINSIRHRPQRTSKESIKLLETFRKDSVLPQLVSTLENP
jgi:colanic acid biosynthesis glycosyl transferase WcaI